MDDLIRRQAAIKAICEDGTWLESQGCADISMAERKQRDADILSDLPSEQPERKKGNWIDEPVYKQTMDGKTWDGFTYCSECKEMYEYSYRSNYCPNCGADMRKQKLQCGDEDTSQGGLMSAT